MKDMIIVVAVLLMFSALPSSLYADPHHGHGRGLPPGLQKKYDRGEALPPGWRKKYSGYDYGYEEPYYGGDYDQYYGEGQPVYIEDHVSRIIKDVRDLSDSIR